ncbi:MAG: ParB-like nuclease domain-containing protein, partial [Phycisphaerae bacterium]|nr:ParB-like nuclease domain-containing protein [Phycisphaerae bacterium]
MSEQNPTNVKGIDVPIVKLTPLRKRKVSKKNYNTLMANLKAVGLIEPLCVCQEGEQYFILDGYIRYTALLELGVETVPCLVLPSRDLYTPNRQVNHLSPQQEVGMLR